MINKVNIKSLLNGFFAGFSFRQKVEHDPNGDLHVIQMKDLQNSYSTIGLNLTKIGSEKISDKNFLRKGDVLLITKGANNVAVEYTLDFEKAIAASAFYVLRPNQKKVIAAYLAWYINQEPVQQHLKANLAGTYIPNLNKGAIEEIAIALPPIEKQELVVDIDRLRRKEFELTTVLQQKRKAFTTALLMDIVNK